MKAFVIHVNGKRLCTAGIGPSGVLLASIAWVGNVARPTPKEGELIFHLGGLDSRTGEDLNYRTPKLKVGDKIIIKIIEADLVDPETKRYVPDLSGGGRASKATGRRQQGAKSTRRAKRKKNIRPLH